MCSNSFCHFNFFKDIEGKKFIHKIAKMKHRKNIKFFSFKNVHHSLEPTKSLFRTCLIISSLILVDRSHKCIAHQCLSLMDKIHRCKSFAREVASIVTATVDKNYH